MSRFIKLNHGIIDADLVVGVSDVFWQEADIKPRKGNSKRPSMGIVKNKTKRIYGFNVYMATTRTTIFPTVSPTAYSSGNRKFVLQTQQETIRLIKNETTKDNMADISEVNRHKEEFFDCSKVIKT